VPNSNISTAGIYTITVRNPAPPAGGIDSTTFATVTVNNKVPTVTGIKPNTAVAGTGSVTFDINGAGNTFLSGAIGLWNGSPLTPTVVTGNKLTVVTTDAEMAAAGVYTVAAENPSPNLGVSTAFVFTIIAPTISLAPAGGLTLPVTSGSVLTASISDMQVGSTVISLTSSNPSVASVAASVVLTANTSQIRFAVTSGITGTAIITAQLPSALGGNVSNPVTITVNFAGGLAPRHAPSRLLAWVSRRRLGELGGAPLLALIPAASALGRPTRRKARGKGGRRQ
jgi:hypothetical protein